MRINPASAELHESIAFAKNIYWFPMPIGINDETKIEFLKRDIFLHHCPFTGIKDLQLEQLKKK